MAQVDLEKMLNDSLPSIVEGMKKQLTNQISYDVQTAAARAVTEHVKQWISDNVIPEITQQLVESKDGLILLAAKIGEAAMPVLVESMMKELRDNLENSWTRKEVFKALFG